MPVDAFTIGQTVATAIIAIGGAASVAVPLMRKAIREESKRASAEIGNKVETAVSSKRVNGFLEAFLRACPYPAWVKVVHRGADGAVEFRMQLINDAYEKAFEVSDWHYKGKTDFEVWPEDVAQAYYTHDAATLAAKKSIRFMEPVRQPSSPLGTEAEPMEFEKAYLNKEGIEAIVGFMRPPLGIVPEAQ